MGWDGGTGRRREKKPGSIHISGSGEGSLGSVCDASGGPESTMGDQTWSGTRVRTHPILGSERCHLGPRAAPGPDKARGRPGHTLPVPRCRRMTTSVSTPAVR